MKRPGSAVSLHTSLLPEMTGFAVIFITPMNMAMSRRGGPMNGRRRARR